MPRPGIRTAEEIRSHVMQMTEQDVRQELADTLDLISGIQFDLEAVMREVGGAGFISPEFKQILDSHGIDTAARRKKG